MTSRTMIRAAIWGVLGFVLSINGLDLFTWGFWAVMALVITIALIEDI